MKNYDKIKSMNIEQLAEFNVRKIEVPTWANDGDGYIDEWQEYKFLCSDGKMYFEENEAIKHEIEYLESEVEE